VVFIPSWEERFPGADYVPGFPVSRRWRMATYIILSRFSPEAFKDPKDFKTLAATVSEKIKTECPGVTWKESYATLGRFDAVDVVEAADVKEVERAAMIIRAYGHSTTETLAATPWKEFLNAL
jgi:uncharacterized protein with GYD domain